MKVCQFNFNNEVDSFTIHVEDDGRVSVPGENGQVLAEYTSIEQLAEIYAQARDVKPENLKNWVLLENGNVYSYVLRAGTAGVDVCEVEEQLEEVFASLSGKYHPLSIARAKEQVMADGARDLTEALVHCSETDVARDVYDAMQAAAENTELAEVPVEEPVDTRSELEKYIDDMADSTPGSLGFFATLAGLDADTEKADVIETLSASIAFSNVTSLKGIFENAVSDAVNEGIGVRDAVDAMAVLTQTTAGTKDDEMKNRMVVAARMAGRDRVNIPVDIVGAAHIRHTAEMVSLADLENAELLVRDNVPYIVRFSDTVDAELEAERDEAAAREAAEAQSVSGADVRRMIETSDEGDGGEEADDDEMEWF